MNKLWPSHEQVMKKNSISSNEHILYKSLTRHEQVAWLINNFNQNKNKLHTKHESYGQFESAKKNSITSKWTCPVQVLFKSLTRHEQVAWLRNNLNQNINKLIKNHE